MQHLERRNNATTPVTFQTLQKTKSEENFRVRKKLSGAEKLLCQSSE
jgi:hypothetical protein